MTKKVLIFSVWFLALAAVTWWLLTAGGMPPMQESSPAASTSTDAQLQLQD
jgi:hypothetical protein